MKRALVMMDMSGLGRCALSVAIPVLSRMGIQAVPLPTALLSAHTGGFGAVEMLGLSGFVTGALDHYARLGERFDAVYAGYLVGDEQLSLLDRAMAQQPDALILIDPVMADHGQFYRGIGESRAEGYRQLLKKADLITPNETEARLLVGAGAEAPVEALLSGLLQLGCKAALVKGVTLADGMGVNAYQAQDGAPVLVPYEKAQGSYPGTGDLFASILLGAMMQGNTAERGIERAARFVRNAVTFTNGQGSPAREGVQLEGLLASL